MTTGVTFIAACCNELYYNRPLLESLLNQTNPSWRLIVVQDGINRDMREWVNSYQDYRISYRESLTKTGSFGCYNRIAALEGYIETFHVVHTSIQDYYLPHAVELILRFVEGVPDICTWDSINHLCGYDVLKVKLEQNYIDWGNFCLPTEKAKQLSIPEPTEYCADWFTIKKGLDEGLFNNHVHIPFCLTIHN